MTEAMQNTLFIAGVGIAGIFIFMTVFYLLIVALDKHFPYNEEEEKNQAAE